MTHYRCQMEIRAENTRRVSKPADFGLSWSFDLKSRGVDVWSEVVEHYSGRRLTYMSDKLIALSSLAHDMKEKINGNYLAGIWKEELVWGLLWECFTIGMKIRYSYIAPSRCKIYRAPSWSWAAGDGAVEWVPRWKPEYFREEVAIIDAKTAAVEGNSLGAVTDGILILAGKLRHIQPATARIWLDDGGSGPGDLYREFSGISYSMESLDWSSPPDVVNSINKEGIWLLLLATYQRHIGDGKCSSGLLLSPANDKEKSIRTFRRVGIFRFKQPSGVPIFQDCLNENVAII